jgi:hypothetical protein
VLEQFEVGSLADDRGSEASRTLDEFSGKVTLVEGYRNAVRLCSYLCYRVADATVVLPVVTGRDDEQAVLDVEKGIAHNVSFLCLCCFGNLSHKFSLFLSIPYYLQQKSCKKAFFLTKNKLLFR